MFLAPQRKRRIASTGEDLHGATFAAIVDA
jgi:hypothetical protein